MKLKEFDKLTDLVYQVEYCDERYSYDERLELFDKEVSYIETIGAEWCDEWHESNPEFELYVHVKDRSDMTLRDFLSVYHSEYEIVYPFPYQNVNELLDKWVVEVALEDYSDGYGMPEDLRLIISLDD